MFLFTFKHTHPKPVKGFADCLLIRPNPRRPYAAVEQEDVAAEEWEMTVCAHLDSWPPPTSHTVYSYDPGVDSLVAEAAAARLQALARAFLGKKRLRARLQAIAEAARVEVRPRRARACVKH